MLKVNGSDKIETREDQDQQKSPVKVRDGENPWKQPSPGRSRGGKQGAWREASGPSDKGSGFKGAVRDGKKSGLQAWKKMMSSDGSSNANSSNSAEGLKAILGVKNKSSNEAASHDSVEGLKNILGVKNESCNQSTADASVGLKNLLGIASSQSNNIDSTQSHSSVSASSDSGPSSAADALMKLMVQTPIKTEQPAFMPQQSTFNFTYVNEGDKQQPPVPTQPIVNTSMIFSHGPMGVYHSPVPHPMVYPNMMPYPAMMPQQPNFNVANSNDTPIPLNRAKKEKLGVEDASLIPSVALKAKK